MATKKRKEEDLVKYVLTKRDELPPDRLYFFDSAFERYQLQNKVIKKLEKLIEESLVVEMEFTHGRKKDIITPAVKELNNTSNAANSTMNSIMRLLDKYTTATKDDSKFMKFLNEDEKE